MRATMSVAAAAILMFEITDLHIVLGGPLDPWRCSNRGARRAILGQGGWPRGVLCQTPLAGVSYCRGAFDLSLDPNCPGPLPNPFPVAACLRDSARTRR